MSELYAFRSGPTYRGATPQEQYEAALSQPMSLASTFFDQAKGGVLESFGLGTAIRDITTPEGAKPEPTGDAYTDTITKIDEAISPRNLAKRIIGTFDNDQPPMSKEAYEASEYARDGVPWDASMTEDRAASLAMAYDAKRVREFYAEKRPITSFVANLAGQATDPINYIPIAGPAVRAAAVARTGKVAGLAATASLDAAANTAIFGLGTASQRRQFGDDVSWQATVSQIATAALIGGAFGTIAGALGSRADATSRMAIEERLSTLKTTQEARIALNEGIDALVRAEDVALSPNATEAVARVADESIALSRPTEMAIVRPEPVKRGPGEIPDAVDFRSLAQDPDARGDTTDMSAVRLEGRVFAAETHEQAISEASARLGGDKVEAAVEADPENTLGHIPWRRDVQTDDITPPVDKTEAFMAGETITYKTFSGQQVTARRVLPSMDHPIGGVEIRAGADGNGRLLMSPVMNEGDLRNFVNGVVRTDNPPAAVDTSPPRPEPIPEGRAQAESRIAKPDDYKALAAQYRVDPETGSFAEEADITQLGIEGRLTEEDLAVLADSQNAFDDGAAYGEALRSVANCLV